jgi:CHAT domain-containing protein/tetratricopeptide (TPR) repeat protein
MTDRRWPGVLAIAAGLMIAAAIAWPRIADGLRARALDLAAAKLPSRPFDGRLHDMPHVPRLAQRGENEGTNLRLRAEAFRVLQNSAAVGLRGKALLLTGDGAAAAAALEHAADGDATTFSDLAAARIHEADQSKNVEPALAGVIAARHALSLSPGLAAAHFNLALALERIGLTNEAADTFVHAATLEPGSAWAAEALSRADGARRTTSTVPKWTAAELQLKDTSDPRQQRSIVASNVPAARRYAEGPYLVDWAEARLAGRREDARAALAFAGVVATALRDVTGDCLAWDAVSAIDRAEAAGEETAVSLARAHLIYRDGRLARRDHDDAHAIPLLENAANQLAARGSPLQYVARYQIIGAYYEQARIDDALASLALIDRMSLRDRGYRVLTAQIGWAHGNCLLVRGAYGEAFDVFDEGYRLATTVRDADLAATLDGLAAQALEYLGDHEEAWKRRARALRLNGLVHNDTRRAVILASAANSQLAARNWSAAAALLDYGLPLAEGARDPLVTGQILAERSVARDETGDHAGAADDRAAASRAVRQVSAREVRERLLGFIDIAEAVAQGSTSPLAAIAYFSRTIDQQKRSTQSSLLPRLYYERARARGASGDRTGEKEDLRAGLDVVQTWERSIATPEQRAAISIWGDAMRRDLIVVELADGDVAAAFADSDTRPEPGNYSTGKSSAGRLDALRSVRAALSPDAAVVEFVRIRENLVVFVVRRDVAVAMTLPSSASAIAAAASVLRNASDERFAVAAADLYTFVLAPFRHYLDGVRTIAFVPDHDLTGLSFGGLFNPEGKRYLAEDFIVVHAPTATAAIRLSHQARDRVATTVVAIGASEFDHARYPDLTKLPNVVREVKDVAATWRRALILVGGEVTAENLRRELPRTGIVHFAGHIIGHGANSRLVISGEGLAARDVARMRLDTAQVVVLAACRGSASHDSPVMYADIGGAFLAAGAPTVIATTNNVDDAEAPRLMVRLHTFLRDGDNAAVALRKTIMLERSAQQSLPISLRFLAIGGTPSLVR